MKYFVPLVILFFSCQNSDQGQGSGDLLMKNKISNLIFPKSSKDFPYTITSDKLYDYKSFLDSKLISGRSVRKVYGKKYSSGYFIIAEIKPNDDEHVAPIISSYILNTLGDVIDSLFLQETIRWEASYDKTFTIDKDLNVELFEIQSGYDLESDSDSLIVNEKHSQYHVDTLKLQFIKDK